MIICRIKRPDGSVVLEERFHEANIPDFKLLTVDNDGRVWIPFYLEAVIPPVEIQVSWEPTL